MDSHPWQLTVVLLEGLRLMRPEKSWRPIVSVEVDKHHIHETALGVDGQNINQRECFRFHEASSSSKVDINVWHRSQSKKKKKRTLVASASHCLGELLKKQDAEHRLEIRLQCRAADQKVSGASKGRPQKGALLRLRLQSPPTIQTNIRSETPPCSPVDSKASSWVKEYEDSSADESSSVATGSITFDSPPIPHPTLRRRRRVKGYAINSDDDCASVSASSDDGKLDIPDTRFLCDDNSFSGTYVNSDAEGDDAHGSDLHNKHEGLIFRYSSTGEIISFCEEGKWVAASSDMLLPRYTEKIVVPPNLTRGERLVATLTMYGELSSAETEDQFDAVFKRLQYEWTFIGGLLVALAAVDTAVFSISPGSIVNVDSYARAAIATSSIASGLGIACDAWFLLRYNWADVSTFIVRARDVFGMYFFFSLSARMPAFCMFISCVALLGFLGLVAYDVWPQGVLVMCFLVGVIMSLQFLVFGAHWCAKRVAQGGRAGGKGVVHVVRVVRSMTT